LVAGVFAVDFFFFGTLGAGVEVEAEAEAEAEAEVEVVGLGMDNAEAPSVGGFGFFGALGFFGLEEGVSVLV
jgi:hypothetical protein